MKVLFVSLEGNIKKGVEKDIDKIISIIKNDFDSDIDEWWEDACLDEEMDIISDNGNYGQELDFFIEHEGKLHDMDEFILARM